MYGEKSFPSLFYSELLSLLDRLSNLKCESIETKCQFFLVPTGTNSLLASSSFLQRLKKKKRKEKFSCFASHFLPSSRELQ